MINILFLIYVNSDAILRDLKSPSLVAGEPKPKFCDIGFFIANY